MLCVFYIFPRIDISRISTLRVDTTLYKIIINLEYKQDNIDHRYWLYF